MKVSGTAGWVGLAIYVATWDYLMDDALSSAFKRSVKHPLRRWPVFLLWGLTTMHLFDALPKGVDPFARLTGSIQGRRLGAPHLREQRVTQG